MNYAEFSDVRDAYFTVALPQDLDFKRYTNAFFAWIADWEARAKVKRPELFERKKLPLFDDFEQTAERR